MALLPRNPVPRMVATTSTTRPRSSVSMATSLAHVRFACLCWITYTSISILGGSSLLATANPILPLSRQAEGQIYPSPLSHAGGQKEPQGGLEPYSNLVSRNWHQETNLQTKPESEHSSQLESRFWHHDSPDRDPFFGSWQSRLPDNTRFTDMTIMGTHDTMAYNRPGRIRLPDISRTQYYDLITQLNLGVRFIDIRMRHFRDQFQAHHGATFLHSNFEEVTSDLCSFLTSDAGNGETVVMRLKRESGSWDIRQKNKQTWGETLNDYFTSDRFGSAECLQKIVYKRPAGSDINEWPTLGQTRGKLLIIEDFELPQRDPKWPQYGPQWNDGNAMKLQDDWRVYALGDKKAKFASVIKFWRDHIDFSPGGTGTTVAGSVGKLRVNHVSGSGVLAWPINVATGRRGLNGQVDDWLKGEGKGLTALGPVVVDFAVEEYARTLVARNFGKEE